MISHAMKRPSLGCLVALLALSGGCGRSVGAPDATTPVDSQPSPLDGMTIASMDGTVQVVFTPPPEAMPLNRLYSIETQLLVDGRPADEGVALTVDAAMPAHRHGMNTVPRVTRTGAGRFLVEGMQLHMEGYWELYFDVTVDGLTERLTVPIEIE